MDSVNQNVQKMLGNFSEFFNLGLHRTFIVLIFLVALGKFS